jgi:hypothetical protein
MSLLPIKLSAAQSDNPEHKKFSLDIRSTITPSGLLKSLAENKNYSRLCYTGDANVYEALKEKMLAHLNRIGSRTDAKSKQKYEQCLQLYKNTCNALDSSDKNHLEKAKSLMQKIIPEFAKTYRF